MSGRDIWRGVVEGKGSKGRWERLMMGECLERSGRGSGRKE